MSLKRPKIYGNIQDAASAILNASPSYITAVGLAASGTNAYAIWFSGSDIASGSILWHMTASGVGTNTHSFPEALFAACQLGVAASGGSAMTAWMKERGL